MSATHTAAAEVAREVNSQISAVANSLAVKGGDDGHEYTFFCECGCLHPVTLTLQAFLDAGRVLSPGHLPMSQEGTDVEGFSSEPLPSR